MSALMSCAVMRSRVPDWRTLPSSTAATFRSRPSYEGGSLDFLGTDDGTRALPSAIRQNSPLREGNMFQEVVGEMTAKLKALGYVE